MQGVKGLVGQGMSGAKRSRTPKSASYPPGSYTFTAPASGWFRFVLWGAGGGGGTAGAERGGASGALVIAERPLAQGQTVALVIGAGGIVDTAGGDTTATFPDAEVLTAGGGSKTTAGAATGKANLGDTLLAGSLGGLSSGSAGTAGLGDAGGAGGSGNGGGGGAPGNSGFTGGAGGATNLGGAGLPAGYSPGGGSGYNPGLATGGDGLALIQQVRLKP